MKTSFALSFLLSLCISFTLSAQDIDTADSTGLVGDHFSLEGALALFKKAESPENFEKLLNEEENKVNNLDLNEDGKIDYIRVIDNMEDDVHALVLQVDVSANEAQDVAVIEIEKQGSENALLQIIGDEDVYGEEVIVEPFEEQVEMDGKGPNADLHVTRVVVNVWFWPSVRFMYRPAYRVYVSPWGWNRYPRYWRPWRPLTWRAYHVHHVRVFRPHCRVVRTHRVVRAHRVYTPHRRSSKVVRTRTTTRVAARGTGGKVTRTTKTTKVAKGKNGKVTRTTKTTKVTKGKNGKVRGKQKTTKVTKGRKGNKAGVKRTTTRKKGKRKG